MEDVLEYIIIITAEGKRLCLGRKDVHFYYRRTDIPADAVIVEAGFRLQPVLASEIRLKIQEIMRYRSQTQPVGIRSLGCVFKNPLEGDRSSGALIEQAGLKGLARGGVRVSPVHANFFEVQEGALFDDFYQLYSIVKKIVKDKFDIELEPEIQIWKD